MQQPSTSFMHAVSISLTHTPLKQAQTIIHQEHTNSHTQNTREWAAIRLYAGCSFIKVISQGGAGKKSKQVCVTTDINVNFFTAAVAVPWRGDSQKNSPLMSTLLIHNLTINNIPAATWWHFQRNYYCLNSLLPEFSFNLQDLMLSGANMKLHKKNKLIHLWRSIALLFEGRITCVFIWLCGAV